MRERRKWKGGIERSGGSSLMTRNDCPSSCQSNVAPDLILNRSRNAFGPTVWPLLVTVLCYHEGQGVEQDYQEAMKWYRKAADQGNARGQYGLGFCYANGDGVIKDYVQAYKWPSTYSIVDRKST